MQTAQSQSLARPVSDEMIVWPAAEILGELTNVRLIAPGGLQFKIDWIALTCESVMTGIGPRALDEGDDQE